MSTNDELDDSDEAFLEYITGDGDDLSDEERLEAQVQQLEDENAELREMVTDLRDEVHGYQEMVKDLAGRVNELGDRVAGQDPSDPRANSFYEDLTTLEKYARMPEDEREELLSTSRQLAVLIFENWTDWAKQLDAGWLINTKPNSNRLYNRSDIKVYLKEASGDDLQSTEVYRAMKQVAKLSVGPDEEYEHVTDDYGREHITGGAFEYHDKVNPDANGGSGQKFKVLKLVDEEAISLP